MLYYLYCVILKVKYERLSVMLLGMSDPWVAAAFIANIAVTAVCVIYGILCYNSGDDTEENR